MTRIYFDKEIRDPSNVDSTLAFKSSDGSAPQANIGFNPKYPYYIDLYWNSMPASVEYMPEKVT